VSLQAAFADQSISCSRLGSPFMGQLCAVLSRCWQESGPLADRCADFQGDIGPAGASLPLRIAGGLHALVISGRAPELALHYPPHRASDAQLTDALVSALRKHEAFLLKWIESAPQTNEVRRSAALIAGAAVVREHFDLPVRLSELGASAGLNLMWDHFALELPGARLGPEAPVLTLSPDWDGPLPPLHLPQIAERAGVDLNPLDPSRPEDLLRLMAFLWPDQPERRRLTEAAAAAVTAPIVQGDAIDWLEQRLQNAPNGQLHLIQHTVAWQYFPAEAQARGRALIEAAGARATQDRPLAWLAMESDGDRQAARGAALTLRLWPGNLTFALARVDFHGRWINWLGAT
jgi:hypothetical protein